MSKERPIIFSSPMVLALLDGRKTQTRRIIKPQPEVSSIPNYGTHAWRPDKQEAHYFDFQNLKSFETAFNPRVCCPYSADRLYVRETWREAFSETHECFAYKADLKYKCGKQTPPDLEQLTALNGGWKPSIHMPKKACRLWLEVVDIRVERLQDISEEDAVCEGARFTNFGNLPGWHFKDIKSHEDCLATAKYAFANLWESINGVNSWTTNPWVWVISLKKMESLCQ